MQTFEGSLDINSCTYAEDLKYPPHHNKLPVSLSLLTQRVGDSPWIYFCFYLCTFFLFVEYNKVFFKGMWEKNQEGQTDEEVVILMFYLKVNIFIFDSCSI